MTNQEIIKEVQHLLDVYDKLKSACFIPHIRGGIERNHIERFYSCPEITWTEGGHSYSAAIHTRCEGYRVIVIKLFYKDDTRTNITAIRNSWLRLCAQEN